MPESVALEMPALAESEKIAPAPKKLVLVDAYSLLFRAFFGGRALTTSDGRPTGALFGFANMLFTIVNGEKPDALVVCWDAPERTLRRQSFEAYKAHRPQIDERLTQQMPPARDLVAAFGVQSAELPGYEADDLIGTLARRGRTEGYSVLILTGDSDQLQLVEDAEPPTRVHMTMRGVTEVKVYDSATVRERYGIGPEQIADFKALTGDSSDNIPGVPGIGDKTAAALLQKWNTLENLLDHLDEVTPPKAQSALKANLEQARFSKQLATIVCDAPLEFIIRPFAPTDEDRQNLRRLFLDLEFKSLLARIPQALLNGVPPVIAGENAAPSESLSVRAVCIESREQWEQALAEVRRIGRAALLTDTDAAPAMRADWRGIAFAASPDVGYYAAVHVPAEDGGISGGLFGNADSPNGFALSPEDVRALVELPEVQLLGHNTKRSLILLRRHGLRPNSPAFDTEIAAYLLDASRSSYSLLDLTEKYLNARLEPGDAFAPGEPLAREAAVVVALEAPLRARLEGLGMNPLLERVDMPLIPVLTDMEMVGTLVDVAYLNTLGARMAVEVEKLEREIFELAGEKFAIGSTKQLQVILYDKLQLPTGKKTKTGYTTDASHLEQLAPQYDIVRKILEWREVTKLKSTYADALVKLVNPQTGRLHTSFNQTVASTGRLSSSEPNMQNIPVRSELGRQIRRAFIAPPGKVLLSCDYSQIELRLLAHVTKDPALVEAFAHDRDVHVATAARVFGVPLEEVTPDQRRQAKTINFAVIYGQSGFALAATLGVGTGQATQWIKDYFASLPGVKQYIDDTIALAHRQKYVETLMGRRRYVEELDSPNPAQRQFGERAAVNMPIQGTAADIMKLAMITVQEYLHAECGQNCTLLLQVHDELVFELEEAELTTVTPRIRALMESAYPGLSVPLRADAKAGRTWAEMSSL